MKHYCEELQKFNQVHRLIGNVSCETLYNQSLTAISKSEAEIGVYSTMIDVGAGCGVLGFAWMNSRLDRQTIFVEPDRKAAAFLMGFFGTDTRCMILPMRIEVVRRSLVDKFAPDTKKVFAATRAFSSSTPLQILFANSELSVPVFKFQLKDNSFILAKKF